MCACEMEQEVCVWLAPLSCFSSTIISQLEAASVNALVDSSAMPRQATSKLARTHLRVKVDVHDAKALCVALEPLKVAAGVTVCVRVCESVSVARAGRRTLSGREAERGQRASYIYSYKYSFKHILNTVSGISSPSLHEGPGIVRGDPGTVRLGAAQLVEVVAAVVSGCVWFVQLCVRCIV